ncbi:MAG: hypothetical protein ACPGLV_16785 [Bacteroidia bacterium]
MNKTVHTLYITTLSLIVVASTIYLSYVGYSYYELPIEERFYHPQYDWFKPSGAFGHGLGIFGTLMILVGVVVYIARKKYGFLERFIRLKYLLEFHIFLCTLGPILILFHTSFKFGGIVSIAFWSMVAVVLSGVVGRFIYVQIPRSIEGRELTLNELKDLQSQIILELRADCAIGIEKLNELIYQNGKLKSTAEVKKQLKNEGIAKSSSKAILSAVAKEHTLAKRIARLNKMQELFKYWHVAHRPFALIMLVIVVVHVVVTLLFGYKWIF